MAQKWATSAGQVGTAWGSISAPATPGGPPPTAAEEAARTVRAAQQTVATVMGAYGLLQDALNVGFANLTAPLAAIFPSLPAATIGAAYLGTPHCHPVHPPSGPPPIPPTPLPSIGMVTLGMSVRVLLNSLPSARCGDIGLAPSCCGIPPAWFKIETGSSNVFIGGARAARILDVCKACKNIPDVPSSLATAVMSAIGKLGVAAGVLGVMADATEAATADDAAMASAKALSAAMQAAQLAADQVKMAIEATMWKDPTMPPTGSIGAIVAPMQGTVLIGGFPMINIPNPVDLLVQRLSRFKLAAPSEEESKAGASACKG